MKITADLERVADSAVNIAQAAHQLNAEAPLHPYIDLPAMARRAQQMVHDALDAFMERNAELAREVCARDDEIDQLYHGIFAEMVDLGGASAVAMVWRAAAAIELGLCNAVLCVIPATPMTPVSAQKPLDVSELMYFGASSNRYGSPQAEFEIPYGNLGQNGPYGQVATLYGATYGYDERAMAKISVDQRINANLTPGAIFHDVPITVDDVVNSPVIAAPLRASLERPASETTADASPRRAELEAAREAKYREIRDAELDFRTGKLSGDDYAAIDAALRAEGLAILDQLEALDGERESADGERESATPRDA